MVTPGKISLLEKKKKWVILNRYFRFKICFCNILYFEINFLKYKICYLVNKNLLEDKTALIFVFNVSMLNVLRHWISVIFDSIASQVTVFKCEILVLPNQKNWQKWRKWSKVIIGKDQEEQRHHHHQHWECGLSCLVSHVPRDTRKLPAWSLQSNLVDSLLPFKKF